MSTTSVSTADPIKRLIAYVHQSSYEDLPENVINAVKKAIVDTVGAAIAGSSAPMGKLVCAMVQERGGKADSTVWCLGDRVPASEAAFANAIMGRCRELDDVHEGSPRLSIGHGGHMNVTIVPAALAAVESRPQPVDGKSLITAIAIGGDLIARLRMAAGSAGRAGWEGPTVSPFGVAATVGKLLHFDPTLLANAMGAAYAHCCGNILSTSDGTWDVWLNAGTAARAGLIAAELAARGHQGATSPLLGGSGLYPLYFRGEYHQQALLSGLGTEFESGNVSVKPYPSCKGTHHAIYTTLTLMNQHQIRCENIKGIVVRTSQYSMQLVAVDDHGAPKPTPRTINEAQFNLAFTIALAAVKGAVFADLLNDSVLEDAHVLRLFAKVTVESTADKDALQQVEGYPPADVDIHTVDGQIYRGCERYVPGHPRNPLSFAAVVEKFWKCTELSIKPMSHSKLDQFLADVEGLEYLDDSRRLAPLLG
ncbi:MAG: 2-methylcitrate dehydratase PrpD [Gammaproteobacteria bacterium]|jgi:2-methylcitrate dehydratase PrpD